MVKLCNMVFCSLLLIQKWVIFTTLSKKLPTLKIHQAVFQPVFYLYCHLFWHRPNQYFISQLSADWQSHSIQSSPSIRNHHPFIFDTELMPEHMMYSKLQTQRTFSAGHNNTYVGLIESQVVNSGRSILTQERNIVIILMLCLTVKIIGWITKMVVPSTSFQVRSWALPYWHSWTTLDVYHW